MVYASAGHPNCYVLGPSGSVELVLEATGFALGLDSKFEFPTASPIKLQPGQILVFLTDGVTDANAGNPRDSFGIQRALDLVRSRCNDRARQIVEALCTAARDFCKPTAQFDDITAVVVKVGETPKN